MEVNMNFKKLTGVLIALCTLTASAMSSFESNRYNLTIGNGIKAEAAESSFIYGDVNNDNSVDSFDLVLIKKEVLKSFSSPLQ